MQQFEKVDQFELHVDTIVKPMILITIYSMVLSLIAQFLYNGLPTFSIKSFLIGFVLVIVYYVVLIFLHEVSHLLGFIVFTRAKLSSLKMGVDLEKGLAYATTTHIMKNKGVRKALMLPLWLTGFLPLILGIYYDQLPLVIVSPLLIAGAIGDFYMYKKLRTLGDDIYVKDPLKLLLHSNSLGIFEFPLKLFSNNLLRCQKH